MALISLQEAARITGLSPATIRNRIKAGVLAGVDMRPPWSSRATWRVQECEIQAMLQPVPAPDPEKDGE